MHASRPRHASGRVRAAYRLGVNEFNGLKRPQITFENVEPA